MHCNDPRLFTRDWLTNRPTTGSRRNDFVAAAHRFQAHARSSRAAHGITHFQDPLVILPPALNPSTDDRHRIAANKQLQPGDSIILDFLISFTTTVWIQQRPHTFLFPPWRHSLAARRRLHTFVTLVRSFRLGHAFDLPGPPTRSRIPVSVCSARSQHLPVPIRGLQHGSSTAS